MSINPLKEFFKRRKAEAKFARAGPGKTLSSNEQGPSGNQASSARQAAAEAAMKRFNKDNSKPAQRPRMAQPTTVSDTATTHPLATDTHQQGNSGQSSNFRSDQKNLLVIDGVPQRNVQIYSTEEMNQRVKCPDLDDEFFRLTVEDAKLIQQRYNEERARNEILKTSEMKRREAEVKKPTTNIARLRFKLPNSFVLEASFSGSETLSVIRDWLATICLDKMELDMKSFDILMGYKPFKGLDFDKTVKELGLMPATTLTIVNKNV